MTVALSMVACPKLKPDRRPARVLQYAFQELRPAKFSGLDSARLRSACAFVLETCVVQLRAAYTLVHPWTANF